MKPFLLVLTFLLMSSEAFAKRLAVLDFTSNNVDKPVLNVMAERVRNTATNQLSASGIKVMDNANMLSLLADQGKDASCISGECEIDLGRNIGADFIITGQLTVIEGDWILDLSLYETAGGTRLKGRQIEATSNKSLRTDLVEETQLLLSGLKGRELGPSSTFQEGFGNRTEEQEWLPQGREMVTVRFESQPVGASVLLNGDILCQTPCSKDIAAGAHQVRFSKQSYSSETRDFMAKKGIAMRIELKPKFGWFAVKSDPSGVSLLLDGEAIGKTPILKRKIDPGIHQIKVDDPCYKPLNYRFQTQAGVFKSDIPLLSLHQRESAIQVFAKSGKNSVSAEVYVDGNRLGSTGEVLKLPLCAKVIEVRGEPGQRWSKTLGLEEKKLSTIQAEFSSLSTLKITTNVNNVTIMVKGKKITPQDVIRRDGKYIYTIRTLGEASITLVKRGWHASSDFFECKAQEICELDMPLKQISVTDVWDDLLDVWMEFPVGVYVGSIGLLGDTMPIEMFAVQMPFLLRLELCHLKIPLTEQANFENLSLLRPGLGFAFNLVEYIDFELGAGVHYTFDWFGASGIGPYSHVAGAEVFFEFADNPLNNNETPLLLFLKGTAEFPIAADGSNAYPRFGIYLGYGGLIDI